MAEVHGSEGPRDHLVEFVNRFASEDCRKVEEDLGEGFVRLRVAEAERRQAKHDIRCVEDVIVEVLRNSRDAGSSRIFLALNKDEGHRRSVTIIDDGIGIPPEHHGRIFEPRVTSKLDTLVEDKYGVHGRGLALYSVKAATEEARVVCSFPARGAIVKLRSDSRRIPEKKDQSTMPTVGFRRGRPHVIRGPNNVLRLALEFSLEHPELKIYVGSPAEVLATMWQLGRKFWGATDDSEFEAGLGGPISGQQDPISFKEAVEKSPYKLWQCVSVVEDAAVLSRVAESHYGLSVSKRNTYRIMNSDIVPLAPLAALFEDKGPERWAKSGSKLDSGPEGVYNVTRYISDDDLDELAAAIASQVKRLGERYFLDLGGQPKILRNRNQLKITVDLRPENLE